MALGATCLLAALRWAFDSAQAAMPAVAQLPQACREAAVHAALTCVVGAPRYFPPGWGPCSVCWGWLCLGVLLGACLVALLWGRSRARSARPPAWIEAASELLACVAAGGERELADLAASLGQSPTDLLCALLRQATESHAPRVSQSDRLTHALHCDCRAFAPVQSPAPSSLGGAKPNYYYGPEGVDAGPATLAAIRLCTTCFARPQPFSQSGQPEPFKAQSILPWPFAASAATGSPLVKKTGFATFARTSDEFKLWCKDARSRHGTTLQRAPCSKALQMHSQPWHVVTHLREATVKGAVAGAAARAARLATAARARAKANTRASTPARAMAARAMAETQQRTWNTWIIWFARLPRLPQMPLLPCCVDESGPVGFIDVFDVQRSSRHACERRRKKKCRAPALPGEPAESPKPPFLGERIGEAANPGPPDDAARRRDRTLHALAQMGLCRSAAPAASDAETLSDTLSAHTPFATPREDCASARPPVLPPAARGDAPPTMPDHTTPGYSPASDGSLPPHSDVRAAGSASRARCVWHSRGPPEQPEARYRNSWLYVPLLHAAAGTLSGEATSAWNRHPHCGERWSRLVRALASAGPIHVDQLVALLHALAEVEGEGVEDADALSNALRRDGTPNLPLGRAVACLTDCDGYIVALAQAALLEAYGSHTVAIEAATLADAFRAHTVERPVTNQSQARRPRRTRVRRRATAARPDWQDAADELPDSPVPECPASPPPPSHLRPPTLTSLDDIDLLNELRHPVPTLQTSTG
ncbi:unnamed protein product [Symbiodinium microadriaticum]|nr:unnamed protein product [Symbiodinium microadriaticum]